MRRALVLLSALLLTALAPPVSAGLKIRAPARQQQPAAVPVAEKAAELKHTPKTDGATSSKPTGLHAAAAKGDAVALRLLIPKDEPERSSMLEQRGSDDRTPLIAAAMGNHLAAVKTLLRTPPFAIFLFLWVHF